MKKQFLLILTVFAFILQCGISKAQIGASCATPDVVSGLPYNATGLNTSSAADNYTNADACGSTYMDGNDYVFEFVPTASMHVSVTLSNTGFGVGLFVIHHCPDDPLATCEAQSTSLTGNPSIADVSLIADSTYYIIVSTNNPFGMNQTTAFDINITELIQWDAAVTSILQPVSSCMLGATENIQITIQNNGIDTISNFDVAYQIDVNPAVVETYSGTILPGDNANFVFSTPADFSGVGITYNVRAYTLLTGEQVPANDTSSTQITHTSVISSFPYLESFESGNGGWTAGGSSSSWALGIPASTIINHAANGSNAWVTNLTGNYNTGEQSFIISPCIDFTGITKPVIELSVWYETGGLMDGAVLQYSKDGGATWYDVGVNGDPNNWYNTTNGWSGSSGDWLAAKHAIDSLAGIANGQLRIYFTGNLFSSSEGIGIDNIKIYDTPADDIGVIEIVSPKNACSLTNYETVEIRITNFGTATQTSYPVEYTTDGGSTWTTETCNITVAPGDTINYTFTATASLGSLGVYNVRAITALLADTVPQNDTSIVTIANTPLYNSFPYYQAFEAGDGYWIAGGTNASWALGVPAGTVINHAASPVNSWVTNLTGDYNAGENSWLLSPCYDFTSLTLPVIELAIWYETTGILDGATLQSTIDNGATWQTVGVNGDPDNWYNTANGWSGNSGEWLVAKHSLSGLSGQSSVRFRILFTGSFISQAEGIGIDNVKIYDSPANDLGVVEIVEPISDCGLSAETVVVKVKNFGTTVQNSYPVLFSSDNGSTWTTETSTISVNPGDTITYTFTATANLSVVGAFSFLAKTGLVTDTVPANDTMQKFIIHIPLINSFPYTEGFEINDGYWAPGGTSSSWAWGTPAATIINSAATGVNAWVTNLTGEANSGESSFLMSPCMDFTFLNNPTIDFQIWYETGFLGSIYLESSIDGGITWTAIGATGDTMWYNGLLGGFNGSAGGWTFAQHLLDNLAGESNVRLRFTYDAGFFGTGEGVGIDDVHIYNCLPPLPSFTYTPTVLDVAFLNTSTNATSYLWDFNDGTTSTLENPTHTFTTPGVYNVILHAYNNCSEDSVIINVIVTGIEEFNNSYYVNCYPNPAHGILFVNIHDVVMDHAVLNIQSVTGSLIYSEEISTISNNFTKKLDVSTLSKGVYVLIIKSDKNQFVKRFIID